LIAEKEASRPYGTCLQETPGLAKASRQHNLVLAQERLVADGSIMRPSELVIFFGLEDRILLRFSATVPFPFLLTEEMASSLGQIVPAHASGFGGDR
jgi:hypothetical protein